MDYSIIIRPLIGAGIGYVTNWIAVKMMFRPLHPIKIGKYTLPFTPGIIPKNQSKLAESIGSTISNNLLTDNDLKEVLLSNEVKQYILSNINLGFNELKENQASLKDTICKFINNNNNYYYSTISLIESNISNSIYETVLDANLGTLISNQIEIAAKEKLKGSMLGFFGGNSIIDSFIPAINEKLDEYIKNNGKELINDMVKKEIEKYSSLSISELYANLKNTDLNFYDIIIACYEKIVDTKVSDFLKAINISKIVSEKIKAMDVLELEKLLLDIMKKELNALVNLGAIIGFILGLLNLLF